MAVLRLTYFAAASARDNLNSNIVTRSSAPTQFPTKISGSGGMGPGILRLSWTPVSPLDYNGPGFAHIVTFCPIPQMVQAACFDKCAEKETRVQLSPTSTFYDIEGKVPYTKYAYRISTKNDKGPGPSTQCKYDFSGEAKPKGAPANLRNVSV